MMTWDFGCGTGLIKFVDLYGNTVVEFSNRGYKVRKIFALESICPKEILD